MTAVRAVGLLSGGLDSALAARLLLDQGIEVTGLHLESPTACRSDVRAVARDLGVPLIVRAKGEEYVRLLRSPRFGYGRNMNPCIDCRRFMFLLGRSCVEELGAAFLFTGEVVGQRPMSQVRGTMLMIDRASGLEGRILRPLSARLLPETEPERRGWVDRGRLLAIRGRGRREQLALAARFGLSSYQSPGGGCLLTDATFSTRLRDLFTHTPEEATRASDLELLALGRHFRVSPAHKIVLGRNQRENAKLASYQDETRWLIEPDGFRGPSALVCGPRASEMLSVALDLIARYAPEVTPDSRVRWREDGEFRSAALGAERSRSCPPNGANHAKVS